MMGTIEDLKQVINKKRVKNGPRAPKSIPTNVTLNDIIKSLPQEVFSQDRFKAYGSVIVTFLCILLSLYFISRTSWFLWPLAWLVISASFAGLFAIGHDCVHLSFAKSRVANDFMGTILMLPLLYPFESWKYQHKNSLKRSPSLRNVINGNFFWLSNAIHWLALFDEKRVSGAGSEEQARVKFSIYSVYAFAGVFFPALLWRVGLFGIVKFWALPWLGFHVLMSTYTILPHLVLEEKNKGFFVHIDYPKWLEFLCNDITLLIARNVSTSVPHYHLRKVVNTLKQQWGDYITEIKFELNLLDDVVNKCGEELEQYMPLCLSPFAPPADPKSIQEGDIFPVPPQHSGFSAWIQSVQSFLSQINWLHAIILIPTPIIGLYGLYTVPLTKATFVWSIVYYYMTGLGITAGYHRLFAHKAYSARQPFRFIIMMLGTGAVEGSVRWWCRDHRAHHRYTDTDKDPYDAQRGFWYSHMGWMLLKQDPAKIGRASIEDLNQDPWIRFQHKHYVPLALFMGIILPTLIAGIFWGDWRGGYFYAAVLRLVFVHHSTFMVNSLAHYLGTAPFADNHTPRDSIITAVLTLGEGYHNFHHEFPHDYRNAIRFYQYDPTKWLIRLMSYIGQTYDLKMFPENEVKKGQIQMRQKMLDQLKTKVDWGLTPDELPVITEETLKEMNEKGFHVVIIDGIVHDVTEFLPDHPGGRAILEAMIGKDATVQFNGGVYAHSNAAHNLLSQMRVGRLAPEVSAKKND